MNTYFVYLSTDYKMIVLLHLHPASPRSSRLLSETTSLNSKTYYSWMYLKHWIILVVFRCSKLYVLQRAVTSCLKRYTLTWHDLPVLASASEESRREAQDQYTISASGIMSGDSLYPKDMIRPAPGTKESSATLAWVSDHWWTHPFEGRGNDRLTDAPVCSWLPVE